LGLLKLVRLASHVLAGALIILFFFSRMDGRERAGHVSRWAVRMLGIFNIQVRTRGGLPDMAEGGALLVANHVSWLDIHVLHSLLPARFISKAEVRGWPLIGWLAEAVGTVFLVREKKADALRVNQAMAGHLRRGDLLAFFPEGTTSDGRGVQPFFPSLFQPAVDAQARVWPVRLRYLDAAGRHSEVAAYHGGMTLGESLWRIARQTKIVVEVEFLPLIPHQPGLKRRDLARMTETAIRGADGGGGRPPGSTAHPPA
jgi:1-acyl-sn-glycerol-3-phosphate acyltransferase